MSKRKGLGLFALVMTVCLLLCACSVKEEKTVIWRDEDGTTELHRATYKDGESEPVFSAPEKDGKTFDTWTVLLDEGGMKIYQASYTDVPAPPAVIQTEKYPMTLPNGITVLGGTLGVDGQDCENLFDDDNDTCWCVDMNTNSPAYVEWSTPSPVEVHGVSILTAEDSAMNPQVWKVSYSEDGQNWTRFHGGTTEEDETNSLQTANAYITFPTVFMRGEEYTTVTAQYFRLEVEQTRGNSLLKIAGFGIMTE